MNVRKIVFCICLLIVCVAGGAKEITIIPQFAVGDTLKYRATAQVIMYHEGDSLVSLTKYLPELIVEEKNDVGFIVKTTNSLEGFSVECSDPASKGQLPDKTDELNDFVASVVLRIQLDADCRPDSILNMNDVKESMIDAYLKMFAREQGIDVENSAEWKMDTKPLLVAAIGMICTPKHLIEEQFCNIPYFNFIGIPLKSGKIPTSLVLTDDLRKMVPDLKNMEIEIKQFVDTVELNMSEDDGFYCIRIKGKSKGNEVEGQLLYAGGILEHGFLSVRKESDTEKFVSNFSLNPIK